MNIIHGKCYWAREKKGKRERERGGEKKQYFSPLIGLLWCRLLQYHVKHIEELWGMRIVYPIGLHSHIFYFRECLWSETSLKSSRSRTICPDHLHDSQWKLKQIASRMYKIFSMANVRFVNGTLPVFFSLFHREKPAFSSWEIIIYPTFAIYSINAFSLLQTVLEMGTACISRCTAYSQWWFVVQV